MSFVWLEAFAQVANCGGGSPADIRYWRRVPLPARGDIASATNQLLQDRRPKPLALDRKPFDPSTEFATMQTPKIMLELTSPPDATIVIRGSTRRPSIATGSPFSTPSRHACLKPPETFSKSAAGRGSTSPCSQAYFPA